MLDAMSSQLADIVSLFRQRFRLSRPQAAEILGVSAQYVRNLERGEDVSTGLPFKPREATLRQIAIKMAEFGFPMTYERLKEASVSSSHGLTSTQQTAEEAHEIMASGTKMLASKHALPVSSITQGGQQTGGLKLVSPGPLVRLPVFGSARCGEPMFALEYAEEWQEWPAIIAKNADAILTVDGDSMKGAGYGAGDQLFVRLLDGAIPTPGNKVIACYPDGSSTCKRLGKDSRGLYLEAMPGDTGSPWRQEIDETIRLVAQVVGVYRKEEV